MMPVGQFSNFINEESFIFHRKMGDMRQRGLPQESTLLIMTISSLIDHVYFKKIICWNASNGNAKAFLRQPLSSSLMVNCEKSDTWKCHGSRYLIPDGFCHYFVPVLAPLLCQWWKIYSIFENFIKFLK